MRRAVWVLVGIAVLAVLCVWAPSALVQRRVAAVLRARLAATGPVEVRARATLMGLVQERVDRIDIDARGLHLDDLVADRLTARLEGISFHRSPDGVVVITSVRAGAAEIDITQGDLERYLRARGVDTPSVTITADGVTATGGLRAGPIVATARMRGELYAVDGRDIYFRVASLDVSGMDVPPSLASIIFAVAAKPLASVRGLPMPVRIERIDSGAGHVTVHARIEAPVP